MVGTPGYPWPPVPAPSGQGGESQRMHLETALRVLREQRPQVAAEIGEYLYSLVLQGQMQDPIVLAACRRLYDHEQQVLQLEASLRAIPVTPPVGQPPGYAPPAPNDPPAAVAGVPATGGNEQPPTIIFPGAGAGAVDADATHIGPSLSEERARASSVGSRFGTGSLNAVPSSPEPEQQALRPADLDSAETRVAPARRPEPAAPNAVKPAERRCTHCRMPLRANDTICPVCGRPATEHAAAAHAAQCRRCGTELRAQDRACPVCGTPRT